MSYQPKEISYFIQQYASESQTIIQKDFRLVNFMQNLQLLCCKCQQEWKNSAFLWLFQLSATMGTGCKSLVLMVWVNPY